MKKFDWEAFKNRKLVVHTKTQEEYNTFMKLCEKHNLKWGGGDKATEFNAFIRHRSETAVSCGDFISNQLEHCYVAYYQREGKAIVEFADLTEEVEETQATEKSAEETPNKKPLDFEFAKKLYELQAKFTIDLFELSKEYDISEADLMKKAIGGFEFLAFLKKVVEK